MLVDAVVVLTRDACFHEAGYLWYTLSGSSRLLMSEVAGTDLWPLGSGVSEAYTAIAIIEYFVLRRKCDILERASLQSSYYATL